MYLAADCMMAYRRGDKSMEAHTGAYLIAETLELLRRWVLSHARK